MKNYDTKVMFGVGLKIQFFFLLFNLFLLLFMSAIAFFSTIYGSTVLFQLHFSFVYRTFSKKFLVLAK